jgi:hypothetical protein
MIQSAENKDRLFDAIIAVVETPIIHHLVEWAIFVGVVSYSLLTGRDIGPFEWHD